MGDPENDDDVITALREEEEGDFVTTPDNATLSEELSRFSSPSQSQSSSCTSITNPFYDGPSLSVTPVPQALDKVSGPSSQHQPLTVERRSSRPSTYTVHTEEEEDEEEHHRGRAMQESRLQQRVILVWNFGYLATCAGFLQLVQLVMSLATLTCLTSAGVEEGGLLNLPLSWHFRIMIFVVVLTLLVTMVTLLGHLTSLIAILGLEWICFDMIVYSLFAFLFLVGSSLVASAFDFYQKMNTGVSEETIHQLVSSVVLGYMCMLLHGLTAFLSYRRWKVQYRLYQRRKLIEEDEIDL